MAGPIRGHWTTRAALTGLAGLALAGLALWGCRSSWEDGRAGGSHTGTGTAHVPRAFTVLASGDVLIHDTVAAQAAAHARHAGRPGYDFRPLLRDARPVIQGADLAICHLEVPLAAPGGPYRYYPLFSAPPQVADALKDAGYDTCSTASNHALDQGAAGVRRTLDRLDQVGLRHTGSARSAAEAARVNLLQVRGVPVAHLSYAYGFNGIPLPAGMPWLANQIDAGRILAEAWRARSAGAQVVIVSLHWGSEYQHEPTPEQRALARQLLGDPAVDLIVGHHAHVVQPFERIGDKWVAYGLGNQLAEQFSLRNPATQETVYARFRFTEPEPGRWRVTRAEYLPMVIHRPPLRIVDPRRALRDPDVPAGDRVRYENALRAIQRNVLRLGADRAGLRLG
ncbi:hypothetical protein LI90_3918 [Carbonactinospora thermoautotrophica]|uniref:Capsule synthesis protein CapA domain-containing protein n=1 Tax=Carbonactinospora thermoautotrophica TaxID=1469144 RepID=A0A132MY93_9ACTN|nr:CapA family protein [Carbonactinospora thermoautotrophica]KWX02871.1 hypothetical protein LI90_3918 [Carbonactinospora thermoautotrophica]